MLGYRNSPAGPWMLRPWITCPVTRATGATGLAAAAGPGHCGPVVRPIQVSLALVSPARNHSYIISSPKRY